MSICLVIERRNRYKEKGYGEEKEGEETHLERLAGVKISRDGKIKKNRNGR